MAARQLSSGDADGTALGQSATDKIGFYGATPVARRAGSTLQAALTNSTGGTANTTTGLATITGTYNSTIIANALTTLYAQLEEIRGALVSVGIIKGSA
jgi:hypothetical protein